MPEKALRLDPMVFTGGRLFAARWEGLISIEPWPGLRAWFRPHGGNAWTPTEPELSLPLGPVEPAGKGFPVVGFDIVSPAQIIDGNYADMFTKAYQCGVPYDLWKRDHLAAYSRHSPDEIRELIQPYACRHWHLLKLLQQCPDAAGLVQSNPGLALALASAPEFVRSTDDPRLGRIREVARLPRRDIAGWLGFPATESAVRILRKCQPSLITPPALRYLRKLFDQPVALKWLRHAPQITTSLIDLLAIDRVIPTLHHLNPDFLNELAHCEEDLTARHGARELLIHEIAQTCALLNDDGHPNYQLGPLQQMHELNSWGTTNRVALPLPKPPLPGTRNMVPLSTCRMLWEEGRAMSNCVASYQGRVANGQLYIYRMLRPVRATVAISRGFRGCWQLNEAKDKKKNLLPPNAIRAIKKWLCRSQPQFYPQRSKIRQKPTMVQLEFQFNLLSPPALPLAS